MHRYYAECKKRASLVPAAAVIPALRAYIKVVAFKTPVVEIRRQQGEGERERDRGMDGWMERGSGGREEGIGGSERERERERERGREKEKRMGLERAYCVR